MLKYSSTYLSKNCLKDSKFSFADSDARGLEEKSDLSVTYDLTFRGIIPTRNTDAICKLPTHIFPIIRITNPNIEDFYGCCLMHHEVE